MQLPALNKSEIKVASKVLDGFFNSHVSNFGEFLTELNAGDLSNAEYVLINLNLQWE